MAKVGIIGAGNVGATAAFLLLLKELADVVMVDLSDSVIGKALDMEQAKPILGFRSSLLGTTDYSMISGCDVVVITAGFPRKPGMARNDLLERNFSVVKSVCGQVKQHAPGSVVIVVTNPVDLMAYVALKTTGFPRHRVIGMGGVLDSARFMSFLAKSCNAEVSSVKAIVLGSHAEEMVPLTKHVSVGGNAVDEGVASEAAEKTRRAGADIVKYLEQGSAYYAPASAVVEMVEAILNDTGKLIPASFYLQGEYGYDGVFLGVPVRLGRQGVIEVVSIQLSESEKALLDSSASSAREKTASVEALFGLAKDI